MEPTPHSELTSRIARFQNQLQQHALDAALIVQNADLYYFTGTIQSGALYVPASGAPLYCVRKDAARARRESTLERVVPFASWRDLPELLQAHGYAAPKHLGFEFDVLPVATFERLRKIFRGAECRDVSSALRRVRMLKSPYEVEQIRAAAQQADQTYQLACQVLREGLSDIEFAAELEHAARLQGHPGVIRMRAFNGEMLFAHVFSGPDSAAPAYLDTPLGGVGPHPSFGQGAGWQRIAAHQPVIVDTGSFANGYLIDQTRTLSVGELPSHLVRAYHDMVAVQQHMEQLVKPGVIWADVYEQCHALAVQLGYADQFMGGKGAQAAFIGHGLGIEIDELPIIAPAFKDDTFEATMTFAFEPKAVFPGQGAVGIENTYVVHPHGIEKLTFSNEELRVVE